MKRLIIAIDGPSGSGKSTTGKSLARRLGYLYIDTGAMYRAVAWMAIQNRVSLDDGQCLAELADHLKIRFLPGETGQRVIVDEEDLTERIRTPEVAQAASRVSTHPGVRHALVRRQREMGREGGIVMDGRDIGTVVFPEADLKIYLDASTEERANRRLLEDRARGLDANLTETIRDIRERDRRDMNRKDSPLRVASDAVLVDTTGKGISQVLDEIWNQIQARMDGDVHRNC